MSRLPGSRSVRAAIPLALLLLSHTPALAVENTANGKALFAEKCEVCHGQYGEISDEVIPNLLGQYPGYLLTQMQAFLSAQVCCRMRRFR